MVNRMAVDFTRPRMLTRITKYDRPVEDLSCFALPNPDTRIWRYMDLGQFLHMVKTRRLTLAPVSVLDDVWEGVLPPAIDGRHPEDQAADRDKTDWSVSCWHISEHESAGMWRLYSARRGIAVQSTVGRLHAAVEDAGLPYSLVKVGYFDYHPQARELPEGFPESGVWREDDRLPFCCKQQAYAFEQELRVLRRGPSDPPKVGQLVGLDRYELGVQPGDLVERVYVHPDTEHWVYELIPMLLDDVVPFGIPFRLTSNLVPDHFEMARGRIQRSDS